MDWTLYEQMKSEIKADTPEEYEEKIKAICEMLGL